MVGFCGLRRVQPILYSPRWQCSNHQPCLLTALCAGFWKLTPYATPGDCSLTNRFGARGCDVSRLTVAEPHNLT